LRQIAILGAGYGGLLTALKLEEKARSIDDVKIILVDKNDFHQYIHLSYEIVTGVKKASGNTVSISELLQKRKLQFHQANVEGVNLKEKSIRTSKGNLTYSELVIALG
jgi:NADH dehydrogenase